MDEATRNQKIPLDCVESAENRRAVAIGRFLPGLSWLEGEDGSCIDRLPAHLWLLQGQVGLFIRLIHYKSQPQSFIIVFQHYNLNKVRNQQRAAMKWNNIKNDFFSLES